MTHFDYHDWQTFGLGLQSTFNVHNNYSMNARKVTDWL